MAKNKYLKSSYDLSISSIRQLQKDLQRYNDSLVFKARELAERLSEKGVKIARVQIADLDAIFTGELIQSLHSEYKGSTEYGAIFAVVTDSEHCAFVEFGTGMIGRDNPYPYPLPSGVNWEYNTGKTIRQAQDDIVVHGDVYVKKGEYFWSYIGKDGKLHITKGLPSRPFMYLTSLELQKEVVKIAKEIFK